MAEFQTMANSRLPTTLTLFAGNVLKVKIIPAKGELVPFKVDITPATGALRLTKNDSRAKPNFQVIELTASSVGSVQVSAKNAKGASAAGLSITVKTALSLPIESTDQGALTRLLLAEAPTPYSAGYNSDTAKTGMQWMRLVVGNRLAMRSGEVATAGAQNWRDVMRAANQFEGFSQYPVIGEKQKKNIADMLAIANDGTHPQQKRFYDHVAAAIAVPQEQAIVDPCSTSLLGWRTAGASAPGGKFKLFKTFAGQDFYTIMK